MSGPIDSDPHLMRTFAYSKSEHLIIESQYKTKSKYSMRKTLITIFFSNKYFILFLMNERISK